MFHGILRRIESNYFLMLLICVSGFNKKSKNIYIFFHQSCAGEQKILYYIFQGANLVLYAEKSEFIVISTNEIMHIYPLSMCGYSWFSKYFYTMIHFYTMIFYGIISHTLTAPNLFTNTNPRESSIL